MVKVATLLLGNAMVLDNDYTGEDKEVLSDDGTTITWTISTNQDSATDGITFPDDGGTVTIEGIIANASALGDGEDVTAEVSVNGVMIKFSPIKLADVTTGLDITVTSASGLQCEAPSDMTMNVATIKFVEGFASALRDDRFARGDFPRHSPGCDRGGEHDGNGNGTRHGR